MIRLGLIGYGAIAETLLTGLAAEGRGRVASIVCLARAETRARAEALLAAHEALAPRRRTVISLSEFIDAGVDLAVECAGQAALGEFGEQVLAAGIDLIPASMGALADDLLHTRLCAAAEVSGARLLLPGGAVGGLDILGAARLSGIQDVLYISRKPPVAWLGTLAERLLDLHGLREEVAFYEGTARVAARDYPRNANVAAAVALAGVGFDLTRVTLIADPKTQRNIHEISFKSACANVQVRIDGLASDRNPRTSLTSGYSIARLVLNQVAHEII